MYLGVDVGGTKTLVAVLNNDGIIKEEARFPTPKNYDHWLLELRNTLHHFEHKDFRAAGIGIPTNRFDREEGIAHRFGNLPWKNIHIQRDAERYIACPVVIENDAKLAGLSEAMLLKHKYDKVLYVTVSTGIGFSLITDQTIDVNIGDGGGKAILLEHKGKLVAWEEFASGRAIAKRYGKLAKDINNPAIWHRVAYDLALGFEELIAITQPEIIVVGGSIGTHFKKYGGYLQEELGKFRIPLVNVPKVIGAQRPEEAVIYGCYDLAKQRYSAAVNV